MRNSIGCDAKVLAAQVLIYELCDLYVTPVDQVDGSPSCDRS
jgi:hypothetical protein